jgi:predicted CXXCH cytochrome family protein
LVTLPGGRVECTTCHEPHTPNLDPVVQKFLVRDSSGGQLCLACHDPARSTATHLQGWSASQHALASHAVNTGTAGNYATVAGNACLSCHAPHGAGMGGRLLRQPEENTCAACHRGTNLTPPLPDVMSAFEGSVYRHPVELSGLHDPAENAFPLSSSRHAECSDCHNAHAAQSGTGASAAPALQPALAGASGVSGVDGVTPLARAVNEYEVCFKCHGNSAGKPQSESFVAYGRTPYRLTFPTVPDPYNTRLDFQSPVSRHNVLQPARAGVSPSLRASMLDLNGNATGRSLAVGTYLYCTDCHNNSRARSSGGTAASGPHGSDFEHLLERRYELEAVPAVAGDTAPGVTYFSGLAGSYALCDKCHDIDNRLLSGDPVFGRHHEHVVEERTSCSTCHAPHGVQNASPVNNSRLLNPDTRIVGPNSAGVVRIDTSARTCSLRCHGENHNNERY